MLRILFLMVLILVGLVLGPYVAGNQGYVRIETASKVIEMSIVMLVIFFAAALATIYLLEWFISRFFRLSRNSYQWFGNRKRRKAQQQTLEGLIKLSEGEYSKAEKLIGKNAKHSDEPILNFIKAAEAAQQRGDELNANQYLIEASKIAGTNNVAVEIARTRILLQQGKLPVARSSVDGLLELAPDNVEALKLAIEIYKRSHAYKALDTILPSIRQRGFLSLEEFEKLEQSVDDGLLDEVMNEDGQEGLLAWWDNQSSRRKRSIYTRTGLIKRLIDIGDHLSAEEIAIETVKKYEDEQLVDFLITLQNLQVEPESKLIKVLEKRGTKAQEHYSDDYARAAGYMLARNGLFDRAKAYFIQLLEHNECVANDRIMALYVAEKTADTSLINQIRQADFKEVNLEIPNIEAELPKEKK